MYSVKHRNIHIHLVQIEVLTNSIADTREKLVPFRASCVI